ncbi:CDIF630_02480 family spore surface protein [Romboutsia sp.]|uniref:CDIF630_02480 family spore surface protein n=1 Tax=Romboutsia sp. TaxID=1965302 RepID=UPI003F322DBE
MQSNKDKALTGENNKRLKKYRPTNNEQNAAWADIDKLQAESKVSIPSMESVNEAKEWVDNGSRL